MSLAPLQTALRAEVDTEVQQRLHEAEADSARVIGEAERQAHALVREGRLEGEAAAAKEATRRRAAATRKAREIRLRARQRQVGELERSSREAVLRARNDPRYPELIERLVAAVHEQLGANAEVNVDPAGLGGVIGRRGRASVDYTLPALADRVVAGLGDELERLWR